MSKWRLSPAETSRFGIQSARADDITADDLPALDAFCREEGVRMLVARVSVHELATVQHMEADGFRLMDTLLTFGFDYATQPIPADTSDHTVRTITPDEADRVADIAAESFAGYGGHYHADPRLDRADCDAAYIDWARRSALGELADIAYGIDQDGQLVGFGMFRMNSATEGEGALFAVAPAARGQGMYPPLLLAGMHWGKQQGAETIIVPTQITNPATQKVCVRHGYELSHAAYTFHKWFD